MTDPDMEGILHDLHNMADVTAELLTDAIGGSHETTTGHPDKFHLTVRQRERILFCAYDTASRARALIDRYNEKGPTDG